MLTSFNFTSLILAAGLGLSLATSATADDGHIFPFDDVDWQPAGLDGAEMAVLWGNEDEGNAIWAFRLQPGVEIPPHTHTNDYWGIAVQGNWVHIDADGHEEATAQGAYTLIKAGELHGDRCEGPEVCVNVLDFMGTGKRDIMFPE